MKQQAFIGISAEINDVFQLGRVESNIRQIFKEREDLSDFEYRIRYCQPKAYGLFSLSASLPEAAKEYLSNELFTILAYPPCKERK